MPAPIRRRVLWAASAALGASSLIAVCGLQPAFAAPPVTSAVAPAAVAAVSGEYAQRFLTMYDKIHDPANGYFSAQGIPYHSVETLIVEAPDYGHETTSEAYSYWVSLEAAYGHVTGDWAPLNHAWDTLEKYMIPTSADQPTTSFYNASSPATYAPEGKYPSAYPAALTSSVQVGVDPIAGELKTAYGTSDIYGMHWLADVDNRYGFGVTPGTGCELGPTASGTSYINTFQRGPQESVWETVPQPSCEEFRFGGTNGFLDLFTGDSSYTKQWKYTAAPDADARAIEAVYWANIWATEQGKASDVAATVAKAAKMGDYLRYAMYDKYFKKIGCTSTSCAAGTGKDSANYLLSWYYAWGGANDTSGGWAWRIGASHNHAGYQNPMAAWALSTQTALQPKGATAVADWGKSLERQLEYYQWLQSADGGIAGGSTNSWDGVYGTPPAGTPTFYGMAYTEAPVYVDPPSNKWFGMQVWSMERVAELYYASGNLKAKAILDKWVAWAMSNTTFTTGASWSVPSDLTWSGAPDTWNPASPGANANLRVTVASTGQDVGVAGSYARTLMYYAAKSGNAAAKANAKTLLDAMWLNNQDAAGVSAPETRKDYSRFDDVLTSPTGDGVYIPAGWTGTMPNGDVIKPGVSFVGIRSWYKNDPAWSKVQTYLDGGAVPTFTYHRFWAQAEVATGLADYERLFSTPSTDTTAPSAPTGLSTTATTATSVSLTWSASTDDVAVTGYDVYRGATRVGSSATTTFTDSGLTASTAYSYTVTAKDAAGNVSAASSALSVTTSAPTPDTTAPSVPTGLAATGTTSATVSLTWQPSTDNVAVTGYDVYRGATLAGSSATTSFTDTGLTASTAYSYTVKAKDAAGNISVASSALSVTTAPVAPVASCKVGYTANSWNTGFSVNVKVTNTGTAPLTGWSLGFAFANGQKVTQGWSASWSQTGAQVTATNAPWNGSIAAGQSVDLGFNGSHTGTNTNPTAFTLNGSACTVG
ncbi:MAG: exoglucanase [Cellulomonadaceae bacterium]|nr:exoglucanase [Cellulomonadaceae bacterium]